MKSQEMAIYREIQKNTDMAIKAIETITDKVYDEDLALQIAKQSLKYSELHNEASGQLLAGKADSYHSSYFADFMQKIGLQYNTLLNTSTGHIAEIMINESNRGMLAMEKILKYNPEAGEQSVRLAKQLIDFEEKNIRCLKDYL